ncbi:MAG TPA: GGDEF domain-containing protein [Coriobacteriia bacterium]
MRSLLELIAVHRRATLALSIIGVLVIGYANYLSRATLEIDLWALLLAPTSAVAWAYPRRSSLVFASYAAVVATLSCDIADGLVLVTTAGEFVVNMGTFLFGALLVNLLATAVRRQTHLASFDALTDTANATRFRESVDLELARGKRYDHPTTVAFVDLDDFKTLNDAQGHLAGDQALQCLAAAMCQQVRVTDSVGRLGGDEFGVLLPQTGEVGARVVLDRVLARVRELAKERLWPISVSIGATTVAGGRRDVTCDEVIGRADKAMYRVKARNKDAVLVERFD